MRRVLPIVILIVGLFPALFAHDRVTTTITWTREISRIVYERCVSCHNEKGMAFSLMTYADARPWAVAIKDEVLSRRMPPWGGVKGFGDFRNDQGLTQEQLELITEWVEGGVPEGKEKDLPPKPRIVKPPEVRANRNQMVLNGDVTLIKPFRLDGLVPDVVPKGVRLRVVAQLPDGSLEPLLWLYEYKTEYRHAFLLRKPLALPAGTIIRGIPAGARLILLPA
jgi:hypothetical protein